MGRTDFARTGLILGVSALALASVACSEDVDSTDIRTSGMYANFEAVADGSGETELLAFLLVGGSNSNTFVDITGEDSLIGTVGDEEKELDEVSDERYGETFDEDEGGTEINIALDRGEEDDGAPDSTATLPEPFELTLDSETTIVRGEDIEFSWDPSDEDGEMSWTLDGDCIFDRDDEGFADDGTFTIDGDDYGQLGDDDGDECTVELTVDRTLEGEVDSAYDGGEFHAIQRRVITFTSVGPEEEEEDEEEVEEEETTDAGVEEEETDDSDAGTESEDADGGAEDTDAGAEDADAGAEADAG